MSHKRNRPSSDGEDREAKGASATGAPSSPPAGTNSSSGNNNNNNNSSGNGPSSSPSPSPRGGSVEEEEECGLGGIPRRRLRRWLDPLSREQLYGLVLSMAMDIPHATERLQNYVESNPVNRKLFIGGLYWETTDETVRAAYERFGEIQDAAVVTDRTSGKSKGYAFVTFKTLEAAEAALDETMTIDGRVVTCNTATQRSDSGGSSQSRSGNSGNADDTSDRKCFISGLSYATTKETLLKHFCEHGEIEEGVVVMDKQTGNSKGYGFITYRSREAARALLASPPKIIDGRTVNFNLANQGRSRTHSGRNNGGGGGGGGGNNNHHHHGGNGGGSHGSNGGGQQHNMMGGGAMGNVAAAALNSGAMIGMGGLGSGSGGSLGDLGAFANMGTGYYQQGQQQQGQGQHNQGGNVMYPPMLPPQMMAAYGVWPGQQQQQQQQQDYTQQGQQQQGEF